MGFLRPCLILRGGDTGAGQKSESTYRLASTFVSKDCRNPEQVAAWLDYMTSDEGLLFWSFGYEGSDYRLDDDGYVVQSEKGEAASLDYGQTGQGAWWMFDNFSWERSILPEPEEDSSTAAEKEVYTASVISLYRAAASSRLPARIIRGICSFS